jgi:dihydropteroate synthase
VPITSDEEWARLSPVLRAIRQAYPDVVLSVDTRNAFVAEQSTACGVQWINDVSGFRDQAMIDAVKSSNVDIVIMHSLSIPEDRTVSLACDEDPIAAVVTFAKERIITLESAGIARNRMIFDVGIGFGKTAEQSALLIQHIEVFHELDVRLLVGHSRKSFFSLITDITAKDRDIETCVTSCYLAHKHVHYLRVHNVEINRRALAMQGMLQQIS